MASTRAQILERFEAIKMWQKGDQRAPHKPLLVLLALSELINNDRTELPFREVDQRLGALLREYGPPRKAHHPEYPFWRLQNDGLWIVTDADQLETRKGNTDAKKTEMLAHDVSGRFVPEVLEAFQSDEQLVAEVVRMMIDRNIPDSRHAEIREELGLEEIAWERRRKSRRDPAFREKVLTAYRRRCAVCELDLRMGDKTVGIEAAHIKWHQANGPDEIPNGIALCSLHHKLLDRGAFTIDPDGYRVVVSKSLIGTGRAGEAQEAYHGRSITTPQENSELPRPDFLEWHEKEVFQGPGRA